MNNKMEKTFVIGLILAEVGIVAFLIAAVKGNMEVAAGMLTFAGVSSWVAIGAKVLNWSRNRNMYGY